MQPSFPPRFKVNSRRGNVLLRLNWPNNWLACCFSPLVSDMEPLQICRILESEEALKTLQSKTFTSPPRRVKQMKWLHANSVLRHVPQLCSYAMWWCGKEATQGTTNTGRTGHGLSTFSIRFMKGNPLDQEQVLNTSNDGKVMGLQLGWEGRGVEAEGV